MPSLEYFITNILFFTPLIAGPIIADKNHKYNTGQYIYLIYTCVIGAFLLYSIYKNLNSSYKIRTVIEGFNQIKEEGISEKKPTLLDYPWRFIRGILLFPGIVLDSIFFPKNRQIRLFSIIIFLILFVISWSYIGSHYSGNSQNWLDAIFGLLISGIIISIILMYTKPESFQKLY